MPKHRSRHETSGKNRDVKRRQKDDGRTTELWNIFHNVIINIINEYIVQ